MYHRFVQNYDGLDTLALSNGIQLLTHYFLCYMRSTWLCSDAFLTPTQPTKQPPDISTSKPPANSFLTLTPLVFHYSDDSVEPRSFPMTLVEHCGSGSTSWFFPGVSVVSAAPSDGVVFKKCQHIASVTWKMRKMGRIRGGEFESSNNGSWSWLNKCFGSGLCLNGLLFRMSTSGSVVGGFNQIQTVVFT